MKKILALLLSISMLLIPMTAFAARINPDVRYIYDDIIIKGSFTDPVASTDVNEAKDKIATLLVLGKNKIVADITDENLLNDPDLILWADQCTVKENGEFEFIIDTFEIPTYTGSGAGYNFVISAPDVAQTFEGFFDYDRDDMETVLVAYINDALPEGISNIITGARTDIPGAKKRIERVAEEIAYTAPTFDKDVVTDYVNLDVVAKNNVNFALQEKTFVKLKDFVTELRNAIDDQPTGGTTPPGGGGSSGSSSGGSSGGGGSFGGAASGGLVAPAGPTNPFLDISNTYWGKDAIVKLYNKGIVKGQGNGYFRPDNTITRAEFVQMVVMAFDFIQQGKVANFTDVTDGDWFANAVKIAYGNGVVNGTTDTTFSPTNNITRQDMMTILYNAAKAKGVNLTSGNASFTDAGNISGYAQEAVAAMVGSNVVSGYTDGSVKPLNNASRAEAAAMLSRLLEVR